MLSKIIKVEKLNFDFSEGHKLCCQKKIGRSRICRRVSHNSFYGLRPKSKTWEVCLKKE